MSIRRMMLFTLGGFFKSIISLFKTRVLSDGGNFEAETNLENQLNTLGSTLFDSASLIITPNAYKERILYSIKPDKVGTNLLQQSETFENSYWIKPLGTITANDAIAPNGTMAADLFTKTSAVNTVSTVWQTTITKFLSTGIYTLSVYIKPKTGNVVLLRMDGNGNTANVLFNFTTKTLTNTGVNIISSTYQELLNGWFRLSLTANVTNIAWAVDVCNLFSNPTGDAMWIWGAQLELGSTATDYISTTDRAIVNGTIGDLTVTRATTGTRVNEQGLIEVVPYNLLQQSQTFNNTWINQNAVITSNVITSPNGTFTGSKLSANNTLNQHRIYNIFNFVGQGVLSVYAKAGEYNFLSLAIGGGNQGQNISFDLLNGTIIGTDVTLIPAIEDVGNGWYRCSISSSNMGAGVNLSYWIMVRESPTTNAYTGDGISGIYIWGAQLVQGTEPKPYQLTTNRLNVARIDYSTGSPAILVEPQRTNLLTYSEDFSNGTWFKLRTTINSNTIVAPDGNLSADGIYPNNGVDFITPYSGGLLYTSGTSSYLQKSAGVLSVGTYTFSFFIKKNNLRYIQPRVSTDFTLSSSALTYNILDLQNKTIYFNDGVSTVKIKDYSNDFVRYEITFNISTSATYYFGFWYCKETSGVTDGTLGYNIWGAQLEAGSNATSYIPTTTSSVTRNADVISKSGISSLIGQTEGVVYCELNITTLGQLAQIVSINTNNTGENVVGFNLESNNFMFCIVRANNVQIFNIAIPSISLGINKIAFSYKSGNTKVYINGVLRATNTLAFTFSNNFSFINVGNLQLTSRILNSTIKTIALFPTQLTDAQCISLTTL